ncbi:HAMP domain-containing histidine kinase [Corynebacterium uberis]|uniref:sensor histidine kinase n=1 Tax=Corynebacterium TaxID=1716 RepID=UPI001D09C819|nr:HAMP domain-containing sensor histidine kinase [Corynebacterium uberis]MCZ9310303.1 HAMP domain-containing histidine kinase [Corynebacterium sp. c6VSa_13]UDL75492.1 HAMP domain-containing histidine kinase [Corynebacterium uberis]UDL77705.1 HAMP domain-containing histidine kinase [Corynebacterium uberis]UDL79989.1 HAMP domain-containing histidine kinase [Corynebacterium uberis]UDL84329.1 HAMP domain-containing histidine kinase [Corynebacterium uberis]
MTATATGRREAVGGIPLRVWLVVIVVAISGAGLIGTSVAVSQVMRNVIESRVDNDLRDSINGWARNAQIFQANPAAVRVPTAYYVSWRFPNGRIQEFYGAGGRPDLSELMDTGRPETVSSDPQSGGTSRWRAMVSNEGGVITVVAKNMATEDSIVARLTAVQTIISLMVLTVMAMLAYYFVFTALRPLREVESTARAIADGDLGRRVPQWPVSTEVGQLAYALNIMLSQLQKSVEDSKTKEEQMRRFVGDASHELRTPLTSLRGYTELYRSGATDDVDMVLGKIEAESKRMSMLVEDLLALTRAEGQRLEFTTVDVLELALGVASTARAAFPGRTVRVENKAAGIPLVEGDASRLHQVVLNLVTNGLRHGGPDATVTVRLSYTGLSNNQVLIEVIDDGRGMPEDHTKHIFERFYRADTSRSRASGGTGLGLAIVKSLIDKHGGTVGVESVVGEGSTFSIRLARKRDD